MDWFELYDEQRDDWLDLPYCERCGQLRGPDPDCAMCGDADDGGCAARGGALASGGLEGSTGGSQPLIGYRRVPR
jgi:hypothetical protein